MKKLLLGAAVSTLMSMAMAANAGTPALSYSLNTGESLIDGPFTLGWSFTVNKTVTVDGLGVFDDSLNGLVESHDVGIWNSAGTLLTSGTVASGTTDPLIANFRYVGVTPVTLAPGTYNIGAVWLDGSDPNVFPGDTGTVTTNPAITYLTSQYVSGGSLSDPTSSFGQPGYFGPNFTLTSTAVPEPATWTMMLLGVGAMGWALRSTRRKSEDEATTA